MARIVSIHSFRGGTGKSNTTANLTALLAQAGYRVGVIDTDIQSPGIHVLFGLDEEKMDRSLNDYLWGKCAIEDAAYDVSPLVRMGKGAAAVMGGGIHLIPSSIKAGEIARVLQEGYDVNLLSDGFRELTKRLKLDYLLIDTHPGLNEETLLSIALSDELIIILRPDQQDYQGTAVTVDVARKLDVPRMMLVVNKVLSSFDFDAVKTRVEQSYDVPVAGVLPLTEEMVALGSSDLFALRYPDHPLTQRLRAIVEQVMA
ncbi:MAG TPA: MinD/ParA family protein [Chloroflexota bacterium]|nr:MinD/ParA family protein [Chloroflexota bacterium]